ncbi:MAG: 3-keto-5-aminohexanoate cleavage protein [Planctomycetota bacterium]
MRIDVENMSKVMIIAAVNGPTTKRQNPNVPLQPDEIIRAACDCCNAGASILHVHPKGPDGLPTGDLSIFSRILQGVRAKCDIPVQYGNDLGMFAASDGARRNASYDERLSILDIDPPMDISTINSGSFSAGGRDFLNPHEFNVRYVEKASSKGIPILCQTYDVSHIANNLQLRDEGALPDPVRFSFVTGNPGGIEAHPKNLMHMIDMVPEGSIWELVAKQNHFPMVMAALALGGHIRVGFEDNVFAFPGELAKSNAQLVEKAVRMVRDAGREVASIDDARRFWGLAKPKSPGSSKR